LVARRLIGTARSPSGISAAFQWRLPRFGQTLVEETPNMFERLAFSQLNGSRRTIAARLAALATAVVVAGGVLVATEQPAAAASCMNVSFVNDATGLAVSAELGYAQTDAFYGELRARATSIGPWERFRECIDANNVFTLQSLANNEYVSVEVNYEGKYQYMLRARASVVGNWEKFVKYDMGEYFVFTGQGYLVTSDQSYTGSEKYMMLANRKTEGSWEHWTQYNA
jgi:hypothetical protein